MQHPTPDIDTLALALYSRAACFAAGVAIPPSLLLASLNAAPDTTLVPAALDRLITQGKLERDETANLRLPMEKETPARRASADADARAGVGRVLLEAAERLDCGDG